jgi:hypothetical protein
MKRILLSILIVLMLASPAFAASYYAQKSGNINADDVWFDAPTGGSGVTGATALAGTHDLYANSFTVTINTSFSAAKISTEAGPAPGTATGTFNTVISTPVTITANIVAGGSACLVPVNSTGNVTVVGNSTGGSGANTYGINCGNGNAISLSGTATGGSSVSNAAGVYQGSSGTALLNNVTGAASYGLYSISVGTASVTGTVTGGSTAGSDGIRALGTGAVTITGNIVNTATAAGASGRITYTPANNTKYIRYGDVYYSAGLGSDVGGTAITGANTAAKVATGTYFVKKDAGVYTQGAAASGGGGGAWGF